MKLVLLLAGAVVALLIACREEPPSPTSTRSPAPTRIMPTVSSPETAIPTPESAPVAVHAPTPEPKPATMPRAIPSGTPTNTQAPPLPTATLARPPAATPESQPASGAGTVPPPTPESTPTPPLPATTPPPPAVTPEQPQPASGPGTVPPRTPEATHTPPPTPASQEEIAAASLSQALPWIDNPQNIHQADATETLIGIWLRDAELGNAIARLSWVAKGTPGDSSYFLRKLDNTASLDIEFARMAIALPWMTDWLTLSDINGLNVLNLLLAQDSELARMALGFPWVVDGVNEDEYRALDYVAAMASVDPELGRMAAGLPWLGDGLDREGDEAYALARLKNMAWEDEDFARVAMNLPWVVDGVADEGWRLDGRHSGEAGYLLFLQEIAEVDPDLAKAIAGLPWYGHEYFASRALKRIVTEGHPEVARIIISKPRFADDLSQIEARALRGLFNIAYEDVDAALFSARTLGTHAGDFDLHFVSSVFGIMNDDPGLVRWRRLTGQSWFADGLDYEEAALIILLGDFAGPSDFPGIAEFSNRQQLYLDLLETHFTQAETISLPLAGDVNIWVFRTEPFPAHQDLPSMIEDVARIAEDFTGLAFPTNDIILLIDDSIGRGAHLSSSMVLGRAVPSSVHHETAHYYFGYNLIDGPVWFSEGGAEFIVALLRDQMGTESLEERKAKLLRLGNSHAECVSRYGNLWGLHADSVLELLSPANNCAYVMGEIFLIELHDTIGADPLAAAFRDMPEKLMLPNSDYFPDRIDRERVREEELHRILLEHTPEYRLEEVNRLYRKLHGGPFLPSE